jgi:hypothetical protein
VAFNLQTMRVYKKTFVEDVMLTPSLIRQCVKGLQNLLALALFAGALLIPLYALTAPFSSTLDVDKSSSTGPQKIHLIISVDWEGFSLDESNLEAFRRFRNDYPEVKIVHFLNAAYFYTPGVDPEIIKNKIRSVIRPGDELGLHIHALETLLTEAGVSYREGETFWGRSESEPINGVRGHDLPLTMFTQDEVRKLIKQSVSTLHQYGFNNLKSFRAGGWAASKEVLNALVLEGFKIDSSAVSSDIVKLVTGKDSPLYKNIVHKLWPEISVRSTEPYEIKTENGSIIEIPNNFGLADYLSGRGLYVQFEKLMNSIEFSEDKPIIVHYGFHQETAQMYLGEVRRAIESLRRYQDSYRVEMKSKTFEDLQVSPFNVKACARAL